MEIPQEVVDAGMTVVFGGVIWAAKRLRGRIEHSPAFAKAKADDAVITDGQKAIEAAKAEVQARWDLDAARWQQRDEDLRKNVTDLVEGTKLTAELHARSLEQLQLYVNKLLDENGKLRDDIRDAERSEASLRKELQDYQAQFQRREEAMSAERRAWDNAVQDLKAKLHKSINKGVAAGAPFSATDVL